MLPEAIGSQTDTAPAVKAIDWQEPLERAVEAATGLWLGTHQNYYGLKHKIAAASVVFDFRAAAEIVQGIVRPRLEDRSAEAYFAMSVLARFLGQRGFFASAVTGQIGDRRTRADHRLSWDYDVEHVTAIPEKLRYVFASGAFERVIAATIKTAPTATAEELEQAEQAKKAVAQFFRDYTPNGEETSKTPMAPPHRPRLLRRLNRPGGSTQRTAKSHRPPSANDRFARARRWLSRPRCRLSPTRRKPVAGANTGTFAAQKSTGRSTRALRVRTVSRPQPGLLASTDPRVTYILSRFRDAPPSILDLRAVAVATPQVVASALWHIILPRANHANDGGCRRLEVSKLPPPPTWMFARVTPDEHDERFWEVCMARSARRRRRSRSYSTPRRGRKRPAGARALSQLSPRSGPQLPIAGCVGARRGGARRAQLADDGEEGPAESATGAPACTGRTESERPPLPARLRPGHLPADWATPASSCSPTAAIAARAGKAETRPLPRRMETLGTRWQFSPHCARPSATPSPPSPRSGGDFPSRWPTTPSSGLNQCAANRFPTACVATACVTGCRTCRGRRRACCATARAGTTSRRPSGLGFRRGWGHCRRFWGSV